MGLGVKISTSVKNSVFVGCDAVTDVLEESISSMIRVKRSSQILTTLVATSNRSTLQRR
jgi:hypothetical protein